MRLSRNALARMGQRAGLLTLKTRAESVAVSVSHLNKVERGDLRPSAALVDRMATVYKQHPDVIQRASRQAIRTLRQLQLDQADEVA